MWLDPAADKAAEAAWQELWRALARRFPGCRGRSGGYTPHLTLGRSGDPQRAVREFAARLGAGRGGDRSGVDARVGYRPVSPVALVNTALCVGVLIYLLTLKQPG